MVLQLLVMVVFVAAFGGLVAVYRYNRRFDRAEQEEIQILRSTWPDRAREALSSEPGAVSVYWVSTPALGKAEKGNQWLFLPAMLGFTPTRMVVFRDAGLEQRETVLLSNVSTFGVVQDRLTVTTTSGQKFLFKTLKEEGDQQAQLAELNSELTMRTKQAPAAGTFSVPDELRKLAELRDQGVLDDQDWDRAKSLYLGKKEDERERSTSELRQLFALHKSGVLTASEFNMKKWDVLARTR